jgi:DNA mismatch endonuclease (patch repair protein)
MAGRLKRVDPLSKEQRSALMSKVRGQGNESTEMFVERILLTNRVRGWVKHPKNILGAPDFYFRRHRLALFVDGCFWHGCPICDRRTPTARSDFWGGKIAQNRRRDDRVRRKLRRQGLHTIRIWEHDVRKGKWLKRVQAFLKKLSPQQKSDSDHGVMHEGRGIRYGLTAH